MEKKAYTTEADAFATSRVGKFGEREGMDNRYEWDAIAHAFQAGQKTPIWRDPDQSQPPLDQEVFVQPPAKTQRPDTLTAIARRKLGLSESYTCCGLTRVDPDGLLVRMEEYIEYSGKNKDKPGWRGEEHTAFVTDAEDKAECAAWEKTTGKCSTCGGDGQEWDGWSTKDGTRFKQCRRCNGSGNAPT